METCLPSLSCHEFSIQSSINLVALGWLSVEGSPIISVFFSVMWAFLLGLMISFSFINLKTGNLVSPCCLGFVQPDPPFCFWSHFTSSGFPSLEKYFSIAHYELVIAFFFFLKWWACVCLYRIGLLASLLSTRYYPKQVFFRLWGQF